MEKAAARALPAAFGIKLASTLFLLSFLFLLGFDLARDQYRREQEAVQRITSASERLTSQISDTLRDVDLVFDALADNPLVLQQLDRQVLSGSEHTMLQHALDAGIEHIAYLSQIRIVDQHCNVVFSSPGGAPVSLQPSSACLWLHGPKRPNDTHFTAASLRGNTGVIVHAQGIYDQRHQLLGMIMADISETSLQPLFADMGIGEYGEVRIQDRQRQLAAFWPNDPAMRLKPLPQNDARQPILRENKQQLYEAPSPRDNQPRLYSERSLDNYPLIITVGMTRHHERGDLIWQLATYTMAWGMLAMLVMWATRRQLRHLRIREQLLSCSEALHESEARWRDILSSLPVAVLLVDIDDERIFYANAAARHMLALGGEDSDWHGAEPGSPAPQLHISPLAEWLRQGHLAHQQEVEIRLETGCKRLVRVSMHNLRLQQKLRCMMVLEDRTSYQDLTASLADSRQRIEEMARTDMLTRLVNRKTAEQSLIYEMNRCQRYGLPLTIALFGIDQFRAFNEQYGRLAGDNVLIAVANELLDSTRSTDICARIAGEEFMVIFTNTPMKYAHRVMERIRSKIATTIFPFAEHSITFSGGMTSWRLGDRLDDITRRADKLMQQAKADGVNGLLCDEETD
ncbi:MULTISPECIES: diguanylate cyclase domain-containing protein [unclassified Paludibacterium]|uniref:sensor domain-containing diguanylate cyclase n=1 Tax=unclassified Paludibacterium TaxID=2618429 RepID=UPI001C0573D6|nr:diguanylate cyclase [Paludibacterium sp. B53371]BEV70536.1 hypothetical protein THUN1379_00180 [Paludibacterium sp. THUN1379]